MKKGFNGKQIISELENVYGEDAYKRTQVYFWISEIKSGREDLNNLDIPGRPLSEGIDDKILYWLNKEPFATVKRLAFLCGHTPITIKKVLTQTLGFKKYHLQWVPHMLTSALKKKRVQYSKSILQQLRIFKMEGYHHIITGDESWIYLRYYHKIMYSQDRENVPKKPRRLIGDPKYMFTIFWNPWDFYIIDVLPKQDKFNSDYFINNILQPLEIKLYPEGRNPHSKKYTVHFDNARPHTSLKTRSFISNSELAQLEHPPYSPDISPSDFYLFGKLKNSMNGYVFENEHDLYDYITNYLKNINHDELMSVFDEWIHRLETIISSNGEYYSK